MPDNSKFIQKHLAKLGLEPYREEEIARELSDHLADHAAALESRGLAKDAAAQQAVNCISNWPQLRKEILAAESEEVTLNYRTKVLWLPALFALTLSNGLLASIQIFGPHTHFFWLNPYSGIHHVVNPYSQFYRVIAWFTFFVPWLILQPLVGALAAYWSRRAGGKVRHQLLAALAPAIALLGVFVLVLPFSIMLDKRVADHIRLNAFLLMTAVWVLLPALPLLFGAVPFLKKPVSQQSPVVS